MTLSPWLRKLVLTTHVTASVGWLGAVIVFLALAVFALTSSNPATVRGAYLVMQPAGTYVLLPLALLSLTTGVISALGTKWGLVQHYWVLIKLLITAVSTAILVLYLQTFRLLAEAAANPATPLTVVRNASPALHSTLALLVLLLATVLAIYKPRGTTGWRSRRRPAVPGAPGIGQG